MSFLTYRENNTRHIIISSEFTTEDKEKVTSSLDTYWKKLEIMFIGVEYIPSCMAILLHRLNSGGDSVSIGTDSFHLSTYMSSLGIIHVFFPQFDKIKTVVKSYKTINDKDIEYLFDHLYHTRGMDFREYSFPQVKKRILKFMKNTGTESLVDLENKIFKNKEFSYSFIDMIAVSYSEFFRDPLFYKNLIGTVFKILESQYKIKIWSAGCSNGMEAYSLSILLKEAGLLDRCIIYATDIKRHLLEEGSNGLFPKSSVVKSNDKYLKSGGKKYLSDYFTNHGSYMKIQSDISDKVNFFVHNLSSDGVFNEFDLILCRNTLIYFNNNLKVRVLELLHSSLSQRGFIGFGKAEKVELYSNELFTPMENTNNIYRKSGEWLKEVAQNG